MEAGHAEPHGLGQEVRLKLGHPKGQNITRPILLQELNERICLMKDGVMESNYPFFCVSFLVKPIFEKWQLSKPVVLDSQKCKFLQISSLNDPQKCVKGLHRAGLYTSADVAANYSNIIWNKAGKHDDILNLSYWRLLKHIELNTSGAAGKNAVKFLQFHSFLQFEFG